MSPHSSAGVLFLFVLVVSVVALNSGLDRADTASEAKGLDSSLKGAAKVPVYEIPRSRLGIAAAQDGARAAITPREHIREHQYADEHTYLERVVSPEAPNSLKDRQVAVAAVKHDLEMASKRMIYDEEVKDDAAKGVAPQTSQKGQRTAIRGLRLNRGLLPGETELKRVSPILRRTVPSAQQTLNEDVLASRRAPPTHDAEMARRREIHDPQQELDSGREKPSGGVLDERDFTAHAPSDERVHGAGRTRGIAAIHDHRGHVEKSSNSQIKIRDIPKAHGHTAVWIPLSLFGFCLVLLLLRRCQGIPSSLLAQSVSRRFSTYSPDGLSKKASQSNVVRHGSPMKRSFFSSLSAFDADLRKVSVVSPTLSKASLGGDS